MGSLEEFQELMGGMLSPRNEVRSAAEKRYEAIPIAQRAQFLFELFQEPAADVEVRSMCMVLLRRLLTNDWEQLWSAWNQSTRDGFRHQLLQITAEEPISMLRKRLADIVAEVARNTIDDDSGRQTWAGVIKFVEMCSTTENASLRETGMILIENVPGIFGVDESRFIPGIKQMFNTNLSFAGDSSVRTSAVRAYVSFLSDHEENPSVIKTLSDLIPHVLKVCQYVVETEDDDDVPLQCLVDLATSVPKILRPHLVEIFNICLSTVADKEKEDSYRDSAFEVLASLCESSPAMIRKHAAQFIPQLVSHCLHLMTELDDDNEEWYLVDTLEGDDDDSSVTVGETSLDRLACALGGKVILPPTLQFISQLIANASDWKSRHAGIMALSTIGEGCKRVMEPMIEQIVDTILPFLNDHHPRVRYAACNAIGQMSTDFAPTLQKKCHGKVVVALLTLLDQLDYPRVAAHAGAALVNFSEECPKNIIAVYLGPMMQKSELVLERTYGALLEKGKKLVLQQIITTIASVADAAQDQFIAFYDRLIAPLKHILAHCNQDDLRLLRGKTVECISLIGLAVGREKFLSDANEIMQMLLASQTKFGEMSADDPQVSYMISAWARICKLLGTDFAAYLPLVMPPVMKAAQFKPEVTVMSEEDAEEQQSDPDWNFIPLGDQQTFGIRTAGLEDKATACEMLVCYARELKGAFADYVEPVAQLMIPLLKFYFHDGVRSAAAECLPCLLSCGAVKGPEFVSQMWLAIFAALVEAVQNEHDMEVVADEFHSLAQCIETLGSSLVTSEQLDQVTALIVAELNKHEERQKDREKSRAEEDHDDEEEHDQNEQIELENGVLSRISDLIHASFFVFGDRYLPYFDQLEDHICNLLQPNRHFGDVQWALCIFDDLIEFGGPNSVKYQNKFYVPMLNALLSDQPEVRQAAAYGFGIMAMHGGNAYAQACAGGLPALASMIEREDCRSTSENTTATENAISAVAKILKYNASMVDASQVIPTFLSWLPVSEDKEETPHVYGYFCDLIESNNPLALGENNSNLPRLLALIVDAFSRGSCEDDQKEGTIIRQRMITIVKQLQSDQSIFEACVNEANLDQAQRATLQQILSL